MTTFRIYFDHGQAHDYEAESCDQFQPGRVILRNADGEVVVNYRDSDIAAVRPIDPQTGLEIDG